jgi:hypothetical protein
MYQYESAVVHLPEIQCARRMNGRRQSLWAYLLLGPSFASSIFEQPLLPSQASHLTTRMEKDAFPPWNVGAVNTVVVTGLRSRFLGNVTCGAFEHDISVKS